jgi:hypothetical protein
VRRGPRSWRSSFVGEAWRCQGGEGLCDLGFLYVLIADEEAEEQRLAVMT